ncbi:MAG: signal recognition particle protein [Chloroflexota bacterium]|jgi:signal recognition particle subunit SRP54|nr:signal recognition particle protein [Dehalococcoidia bacterium]MEC9446123.1 signal recognition particle protein [Chloroflexota bacterium]MED5404751.1 signal recognition particle protein [Chloroflexota bacterium]MEE3248141.1 signal recognition particle protein [Chloroflexota bacterium]PKB62208.1 MAG: signal recognition particle protein [SAR202 cluster bacterium Ae2-Chloro-G3]|tara:strand:- start:14083 stop:15420 length:1338 start_codon:yes stop_codon:yes gene_type:complete
MFENLTDRLTGILNKLTSKGRLTESDVDEALALVRRSLLEADVNFRVARDFVAAVKERAIGSDVLESLSPGQQVVKIVQDELTQLLSGGDNSLTLSSQPVTAIMLVGLQGSGKTTTAAKLALHLRRESHKSLLIAADLRRPAAIQQLETLGKQLDISVYSEDPESSTVVQVAKNGLEKARQLGVNWAIIDTGGRIQIDEDLMQELDDVKKAINPQEVILVVDAMTGQEAVNAAEGFHERVNLTGLIMSKMDGDARGGAALSITRVTGVPIKFLGVGERPDGLEAYHPDRLASRILAMGDILTLIEKAQEAVDDKQAEEMERKFRQASFDLEDFLTQIQSVKKMGSLSSVMEMIPGMGQLSKKMPMGDLDDGRVERIEAIIRSMTPQERQRPEILNGSRRRRISKGSGTTPADVNQLLNQFKQTQKMMKQMSKSRNPMQLMKMLKG